MSVRPPRASPRVGASDTDAAFLGLRRVAVATPAGVVAARVGREAGGPALVLLHGAAGSWTTWAPLLRTAEAGGIPLSDIVAIDLPGWGESGDAAGVTGVAGMADAVAAVAGSLGYRSWRVVGHSLGGFVALDLAARYPDATLAVTLVSPTGAGVLEAVRRPLRGGVALPWFAGMLLAMRTLGALGTGGRALVRGLARLGLLPLLTAPLFTARMAPSVIAAFADEVRPATFARAARAAGRYDERAWRGIRCPVRALRGARDVFTRETDAAAFAALVPDFAEQRLADAGHFAHIERPDAVLDALGR